VNAPIFLRAVEGALTSLSLWLGWYPQAQASPKALGHSSLNTAFDEKSGKIKKAGPEITGKIRSQGTSDLLFPPDAFDLSICRQLHCQ